MSADDDLPLGLQIPDSLMKNGIEVDDEDSAYFTIRGHSHLLEGMPVGGRQWVGMLHIKSPSDSAMLRPHDARAVRDWIDLILTRGLDEPRPIHDDEGCASSEAEGYPEDLCPACYTKLYLRTPGATS